MDRGFWSLLPEDMRIDTVTACSGSIVIMAATTGNSASCPECGFASDGVHKYRQRTLADLPWIGKTVELRVRVRHFRCRNRYCLRKTFVERLNDTAIPYSRRTGRLGKTLLRIAYELAERQALDKPITWVCPSAPIRY